MKVYIAESSNRTFISGWASCLAWCFNQIETGQSEYIKIYVARPNEKVMRVVAEATSLGLAIITNGRTRKTPKHLRHA